MDLKSILSGLRSAKSNIQAVDRQLGSLREKRDALRTAPANCDELIAFFERGVDEACATYEDRLTRWYFGNGKLAKYPGVALKDRPAPQLLALKNSPWDTSAALAPETGLDHGVAEPGLLAVTYFLAPAIRAAIPAMVAKHFGTSKGHLCCEDRDAKLAALDAEITELEGQRAKLIAELDEARSAAQ